MRKGVLKRRLVRKECPWLDNDLEKGTVVYEYSGCTYGAIGPNGIAVTLQPNELPFFEVPESAVDWED